MLQSQERSRMSPAAWILYNFANRKKGNVTDKYPISDQPPLPDKHTFTEEGTGDNIADEDSVITELEKRQGSGIPFGTTAIVCDCRDPGGVYLRSPVILSKN